MKVIVIKKSESIIYNGEIYKYDDTFEVDDAIGKSLIERGYVNEVTYPEPLPEAEAEAEAEIVEGYLDEKDLEGMTYAELKHLAAEMGLDATGKKADLISRISGEAVNVEAEAVLEEETEEADELPNTNMPE